jgi:nicotinamidase-related amidase
MAVHKLEREKAAVLVIDIQERLCAAMAPERLERVLNRSRALLQGAKALGLPVVVTEQYPKGLGHTVPPLRELLGEKAPVEKVRFSCAVPEVLQQLEGRTQLLVAGMEAHICVFQTVRDLAARGLAPYLCQDAALSRTEEDRRVGLKLAQEAGAVLTTVEAALFDLVGGAGTPEFKAISAAVK